MTEELTAAEVVEVIEWLASEVDDDQQAILLVLLSMLADLEPRLIRRSLQGAAIASLTDEQLAREMARRGLMGVA